MRGSTPSQRYLTSEEFAELVRSPVDTVRYWRYVGTGPRSFKVGRRVLYSETDVIAWIAERASGSDDVA